ncbi:helix-turn-helix transcriptional regulator [Rhodocytophaga rosea]|uniref:Helix-turn-helix transcriptional regulator n=1 Tax=Rhodocytophaga rosea TaxID=2704465 RepID=A0A6C0GEP9_9BACT|nr:AraC family transcriptional regulator [Rhodocytophaga rosea]QHT66471.1 helix-turn-helix transcriptional regulator [Rhodocytophaga rosea]
MKTNSLFIKNMVCDRCIRVVQEEVEKAGLQVKQVVLGEAVIEGEISQAQMNNIQDRLSAHGFEIIDDRKAAIIEKIKNPVVAHIHHNQSGAQLHTNYSDYLSEALHMDYHYLSALFSSMENVTIERYIILQKIERVKELLIYNELTLSEIAWQMGYSSVQHLSSQFRKVTGYTPSAFKQIRENKRKSLDQVGKEEPA